MWHPWLNKHYQLISWLSPTKYIRAIPLKRVGGRKFSVIPRTKLGFLYPPGQKRVFFLRPRTQNRIFTPPPLDLFISCDPLDSFSPILSPSESFSPHGQHFFFNPPQKRYFPYPLSSPTSTLFNGIALTKYCTKIYNDYIFSLTKN